MSWERDCDCVVWEVSWSGGEGVVLVSELGWGCVGCEIIEWCFCWLSGVIVVGKDDYNWVISVLESIDDGIGEGFCCCDLVGIWMNMLVLYGKGLKNGICCGVVFRRVRVN